MKQKIHTLFLNGKTYLTSSGSFDKIELVWIEGLDQSGSTKEEDSEKADRQAANGCTEKEKSNIIYDRLPVFDGNPFGVYLFEFLFWYAGQPWRVCQKYISRDFRQHVISVAISADLCICNVYCKYENPYRPSVSCYAPQNRHSESFHIQIGRAHV